MLSDYQEIIKNWEIAINSQGFTTDQVAKQLDTVARKYQALKDNLTAAIMNGGNGGITQTLKDWLDGLNMIMRVLNNFDASVYSAGFRVAEFTTSIYLAHKALNAVKAAMIALGITATKTMDMISLASTKNIAGVVLFAIATAAEYAIQKLDELNNAEQLALEASAKEYAANAELMDITAKRSDFVDALCSSYITMKQAIDTNNLSSEKQVQLQNDIKETEKQLTSVLGSGAMIRIKNSEDVSAAVNTEKNAYLTANQKKQESLKMLMKSETAAAMEKNQFARQEIERIKNEVQAYMDGNAERIKSDNLFLEAKAKFYEILAGWEENQARVAGEKRAQLIKQLNENAEHYDKYGDEASKIRRDSLTKQVAQLSKQYNEANDRAKGYRYNAGVAAYTDYLEQMEALKEKSLSIITSTGNALRTYGEDEAGGGNNVIPEEPKASSGRADSRQNNMQDPRILAHVSRIDEIASNTSNQVSLLNDIKSQQGNSKELSIQTFDTYQRGIDELKAERQKLNDYLYTKNVNAFNGQFSVTISDTAASDAVVEAAMPYLEKTMENGTEGCVEAVTKIGEKTSSFLAKELENGVVYVPRLISDAKNAGISVVPYDANNVGAGDIIVYGNEDHVVMADGKGGYVGNSSSLNHVVHGSDYTAMGGQVPTQIIKTGTITGERKVQWSDSLANYAIDNDGTMLDAGTWNKAGLSGQIKLIEQALQVKGQENNEFLMQFSKVLLADLKSLNDADAKTRSLITQQANQWFTDMNAEVSQAGTTASQKGNRELFMLGSGATEYDKARIELQKNTAELSTMSEIVERKQTQDLKNTVAGKAFLDSYLQKQMTQRDLQFKTVVAMYNDAKATTDHNVKMRDYGYNNTDDRMGVKRATDTLADAMVQVELQRRQLELARDTDEKNYQEIRKMEESYKDALEALRNAQRQYNQQVLDGFEQIAEDFMFNGKSFKDIVDNLWQDLGKDALRALFGQDIGGNHSFLATLLGIGKPDEEMAKAQAQEELKNVPLINNTSATDRNTLAVNQLTQAMLGQALTPLANSKYTFDVTRNAYESARPFSLQENAWNNAVATTGFGSQPTYDFEADMKQWKQSNDYLNRTMAQSNKLNATGNTEQKKSNDALGKNTNASLQVATGLMGIGNAFANGDWLGGLLGIAQMGMGFGWWNTGGKFADGGAPAGKVTGAGTGRSDSILAYLANKDKFVWLSNGEYVINEKSAKALGYDTLDALNGYATGGSLDSSPTNPVPYIPTINPQVAKKATRISGNSTTEALLRKQNKYMAEQNSMLKNMGESGNGQVIVLNTQASSADVMKALQENPRAVQAILGRQQRMGFR